MNHEFSHKTRQASLDRFRSETFDLLVIGGGITGAATARDAASRGIKVALVEARDFAWGTSSRSSKLIHGGLRYLENMELKLVFEALSERTRLLKLVPHMVRPLEFYLPVYRGDHPGRWMLSIGLWLYDLLSLFRTPGFHRSLSRKKLLAKLPFLKAEGLKGGFKYYDASMWDDVLSVETLRSASSLGAAIANYTEAVTPLWEENQIRGFEVLDKETGQKFPLRAKRVVVCAGPWTDLVGSKLNQQWKHWLNPSKGVHLIFDLKRLPVPGAVVMGHPDDGRISFVIPRPDFGDGVVIVGTTDGPTPADPEKAEIEPADVRYLMDLLNKYFPDLRLTTSDIVSAYVGVRPLMGSQSSTTGSEGSSKSASSLQKVSREHYIGRGPGGTVLVAGGKYTTHRTMAREIVDVTLQTWKKDHEEHKAPPLPDRIGPSRTDTPLNDEACRFDTLGEAIRTGMVLHLDDFYLRRTALYASRKDHGLPLAGELSKVWAEEMGKSEDERKAELERLQAELERRSSWKRNLGE